MQSIKTHIKEISASRQQNLRMNGSPKGSMHDGTGQGK